MYHPETNISYSLSYLCTKFDDFSPSTSRDMVGADAEILYVSLLSGLLNHWSPCMSNKYVKLILCSICRIMRTETEFVKLRSGFSTAN